MFYISPAISFDVEGLPPAKQAAPLLGPVHAHRDRVIALLSALRSASPPGFAPYRGAVAMALTLFSPEDLPPGDPTNFLGGVADVLQARADTPHLGELSRVAAYQNDAQLRYVRFKQQRASTTHYTVQLREISSLPLNVAQVAQRRTRRSPESQSGGIDHDLIRAVDARALDFANLVLRRERGTTVSDLGAVIRWSVSTGLITAPVGASLAQHASQSAALADAVFVQSLRVARETDAMFSGRTPTPSDAIAELMRTCSAFQTIDWGSSRQSPALRMSAQGDQLESVLCPLLSSILELAAAAVRPRVRVCADETCGKLFLDRTRNGSRIWCSMNTCGSRAKVRTFRMRHAQVEESALPYVVT